MGQRAEGREHRAKGRGQRAKGMGQRVESKEKKGLHIATKKFV
jgi:hypothetical protein